MQNYFEINMDYKESQYSSSSSSCSNTRKKKGPAASKKIAPRKMLKGTRRRMRRVVVTASASSCGENTPPPPLKVPDCAKNIQPSVVDAWSPYAKSSSIIARELTRLGKENGVEDPSVDCNGYLRIGFVDEDEMFNMPGLVNSMAEGMLLTPPAMKRGFNWGHHDDLVDDDYIDCINLWGV